MQQILRCALFISGLYSYYNANAQQDTTSVGRPAMDSAKTKQLKTVVVTAQKTRLIEHQLDKIVVNANALVSTAGGNAIDVLNMAPGVLVDENGSISLKGREGVIIYIDDKPTRLTGTDLVNYLRSLSVSMIDQIELMPNPSSRYNADGTAIINIRLKKLKTGGFNGNATVSARQSRYFRSNNSLLLNYRNTHFNIYSTAGYSVFNGYFSSHRQRVYTYPNNSLSYTLLQDVHENNHDQNFNYNVGIDYFVSKNTTVGVLCNGYRQPYREKGKYNNQFYGNTDKSDSAISSNSRFTTNTHRNALNLNLQHFLAGHRREINVNLDYLQYANQANQHLESEVHHPDDPIATPSVLITASPYTALIYSAKVNYTDTLFGSLKWEQGVQTIYSERNNTSNYFNQSGNDLYPDHRLTNKFRYRENIHAAFVTLQKSFNRFSAQAGIRMESTAGNALQYNMALKPDTAFTLHYTNMFPTLYLLYKLDSSGKNTLGFSAGRRIERPSYNDLNPSSFYFDRNTSNTGNSLLQPAFSNNFELTYTHNRFIAGINYSRTKGLITRGSKQVGDAFITMPVNVDLYTTIGTSINWTFNITRWWTVNIAQELINSHYKGEIFNEGLYNNENLTTFYLKTYHQFKFNNGWSGDLTTTYRSKLLLWQTTNQGRSMIYGGIQKKLTEKATISLTGSDIFHTAKTRRLTKIQHAEVYYYLESDTQGLGISFSYRFGKSVNRRERKTGIEAEAGRVN
ncbi:MULTISPECIES: outer membrane beta-barrel family protein [Niastella]|uniref:Outer membrane beta-barrel protein n=1 Tax=Niastella soli TaxID=2821487 RepID=A0ABS3YWX0_9BACT|nr:outer membrane beta-barrel family protein [Niastella soli]MBO9202427.1 outer membrane beta-barrel protein [Niastella soli]